MEELLYIYDRDNGEPCGCGACKFWINNPRESNCDGEMGGESSVVSCKRYFPAAIAKGTVANSAQQLKPAMPSFEELWSRIEQEYAALGFNYQNYKLFAVKDGARDMYKLVTAVI